MKTSIALLALALLLAAAWGRSAAEKPPLRRPAPPVVEALPVEATAPHSFLEALAGAALPSTSVAMESSWPSQRNAVWTEVARLLEQAYAAVYDERYLRAVGACEEVLRIDPHYGVAVELRTLAQRLNHMTIGDYGSIYRAIEPWIVRTNENPARPSIPFPDTFLLPSPEEWATRWPLFGTNDSARLDDGEPTIEGIHRKLDTMRIDLAFENTKLEDILAFIRDFSGLNIILDAAVRGHVEPDKAITFKVKDLVLKNVLKLLLAQFQLDYFVTEERVVLLTDYRSPRASAFPTISDGGRDILNILSHPFSDPPLTPQEPAAFIESLYIDLDVQNVPMSYVVDVLRSGTGLDLRLAEDVEETISFKVAGTSLRAALMLLLQPRNLTLTFKDSTVWIGRPGRG